MPAPDPLQTLARLYNLQAVYHDGLGQLRNAPPEAILSVLKSLGAAVESMADVPNALRARHQELWQRAIEPVIVAWQGQPLNIKLRLPVRSAQLPITGEIVLENGERIEGQFDELKIARPLIKEVEGARYVARTLVRHAPLPLGSHWVHLRVGELNLESYLFAAPYHAYGHPEPNAKRWGVFCPLYAVYSGRSWGAGDVSDLAELARWVGALAGQAVSTLPMLAAFLDEPFNPSPYAPVSRLYWNEFYLDVTKISELAQCPAAQALLDSEEFRRELEAVRGQSLVDYRKVMALKRKAIEEMLDNFLPMSSARRAVFENFVAAQPGLREYAAFRAKGEHERKPWPYWPEADRNGALAPNGYDERAQWYHLYVQWLCDEQACWLRRETRKDGTALYLDFPLGVNRDGYDVWRERDLFALRASAGAPPDGLFVKGQNWGFPPYHPGAIRRQGYRYFRDCLRHHMAYASMLRIDHVMGLHRVFWVPDGFSATDGLYVHNRAAEYYAILSLESHRHQVRVVGENLGTVPPYVTEALARHKILGMHVGQFGVGTDPANALDPVPENTVASLNTHDTATFMSFWTGADIDDRLALGSLDQEQAQQEHGYRAAQRHALVLYLRSIGLLGDDTAAAAVIEAWLSFFARGAEEFLLVNLEDLWLESAPQNVPGTWQERPNWRRKARYSLDEIRAMPEILALLKTIGDIRRRIS
ncbi:MAG: 4-alpha-glucanotransferase [Candidatus Binatia bacterium]